MHCRSDEHFKLSLGALDTLVTIKPTKKWEGKRRKGRERGEKEGKGEERKGKWDRKGEGDRGKKKNGKKEKRKVKGQERE